MTHLERQEMWQKAKVQGPNALVNKILESYIQWELRVWILKEIHFPCGKVDASAK